MMRFYFYLTFTLLITHQSFAQKDDENLKFEKRVKEEVERQIKLIKKKSLGQLTSELLEKERDLNKREKALNQRKEQLDLNEESLLKKITEFEMQKEKILGCLEEHKKGEQMRVQQMVEVVSNMKPQKAADLLSTQESTISIKIIEKIDPTRASKIFNLMDKEVSARLQKQYLNMQK